jgi:[ribosomal protein S18]-alanine N-acetyltransferase
VVAANVLTVIPYERRYRAQSLDLISYSFQRHSHLDWYEPDEWLDAVGGVTYLAWRGAHLVGMLSATAPSHGMSWIRLIAVADGLPEGDVLECLWRPTADALRAAGAASCWLLLLEPWLEYFTPVFGMTEAERLITLRREGDSVPDIGAPDVTVSLAALDDVPAMVAVDHAAFQPPYQMVPADMRRAYRFSALSSVARVDGTVVGYQLSTRHGDQGHLARLAVDPAMQGRRVGALLIADMAAAFARRGVELVTVNTQMTNERSLRVYAATGFRRSGYDIPIYRANL